MWEVDPRARAANILPNRVSSRLAHEIGVDASDAQSKSSETASKCSGFFRDDGTLNVNSRNDELVNFVAAQSGFVSNDQDLVGALSAFRLPLCSTQEDSYLSKVMSDGIFSDFMQTLELTNVTLNAILLKCMCGPYVGAITASSGTTAPVSADLIRRFVPTSTLPDGVLKLRLSETVADNWPVLINEWPSVGEHVDAVDELHEERFAILLSVLAPPNYCREIEDHKEQKVWRVWKDWRPGHYLVCEKGEHFDARMKIFNTWFSRQGEPGIRLFDSSGNFDYLRTRFYCSWFSNECRESLNGQQTSLFKLSQRPKNDREKNDLLAFLRNPDYAGKFAVTDFMVLPLMFCVSLGWGNDELLLKPLKPSKPRL